MSVKDKLRVARNKRDRARKQGDHGLVEFFKNRVRALLKRISKQERERRKSRRELRKTYDPVAFDTCPVSPIVAAVLDDCRDHGVVFGVISGDRRDGIAQKFGHQSQAQVYADFLNGTGLPANPPNSSTHEYVNGGNGGTPAFSDVPTGAKLPPYRLGLDMRSNGEASDFCAGAKQLGYDFFQPYPTGTELHHVCMRSDPLSHLVKRGRV